MSGVHVIAPRTARQAHTENCRRRIQEELKGSAKAHEATRRVKEYQDRAAEKGTKRTKADQEEVRQQREHRESTARKEQDAPTSSSSGSGDVVPTQSSSSSNAVKRMTVKEEMVVRRPSRRGRPRWSIQKIQSAMMGNG